MSHKKKSSKLMTTVITLIVLALLAGGGYFIWKGMTDEPDIAYDGQPPSQEEISDMDPQPTGGRIIAPEVDLDAPLGEISIPQSNIINPPDFEHVFIFREYGTVDDPDSGTVYAATHSLKGSNSPGNDLINVDTGAPTLGEDDEIAVDGQKYQVIESHKTSKTELPADEDIWDADIDNRLVLITCLQRTAGKSIDNVVTIAVKDGETLDDAD